MKTIDCRGLACPEPVLRTKRELESSREALCILLNDGAPRENVTRFARNHGYKISESADGSTWALTLTPADGAALTGTVPSSPAGERVLLITSDQMGNGPEELGRLLMRNFIHTLLETAQQPDRILFLNSGVLLAVQGAETVEALTRLAERGVEIFACGLCLDYFNKKDQLAAGSVTNMFSTAETLLGAASVIRP